MKISSLKRYELSTIPSASGIEKANGTFWVIGDNSPFLFQLDETFQLIHKTTIGKSPNAINGIIPKKVKMDLEAMVSMKWEEDSILFLFGSGSKLPERAIGWKINLLNPELQHKYDLTSFFDLLMEETKLKEDDLNIEAAVELNGKIYLFNRGKNKLISFKSNQFIEFLTGKRSDIKIKSYSIELPQINGVSAGFSGATADVTADRIVFTASVENTSNWIDDGEVLGSFIGLINLNDIENHYVPSTVFIEENDIPLFIKAESITLNKIEKDTYDCIIVTDSDGGISELIEITVHF